MTAALLYGQAVAASSGTDWVAVSGLVVSGVSLLVAGAAYRRSGRQWRREGPVLAFDLYVVVYRQPGTGVAHRITGRLEIVNVGRMPAVLRAARVYGPWGPPQEVYTGSLRTLRPTEFELSSGAVFRRPGRQVREALDRPPPEDLFAEEIVKSITGEPEDLVRAVVVRGDGEKITRARRTVVSSLEEPWRGLVGKP